MSFDINFHVYGFFIGIAILISASISSRFARKLPNYKLLTTNYSLLWWILIPGLIGARFYNVLDFWQFYSKDLVKIFYVWEGGLGILGGLIGGILGLWMFLKFKMQNAKCKIVSLREISRREKIKNLKFNELFLLLLDVVVIGLPVGQAIGRLGNFFNQELYGLPTDLPWGIYIRPENRLPGYGPPAGGEKFHPLFLYEAIWCLAIFIILVFLIEQRSIAFSTQKKISPNSSLQKRGISPFCKGGLRGIFLFDGSLFFSYLGLYGLGRFFLEFLRPESWMMVLPLVNWHLRVAQVVSIIFIIVSLRFFYGNRRRWTEKNTTAGDNN